MKPFNHPYLTIFLVVIAGFIGVWSGHANNDRIQGAVLDAAQAKHDAILTRQIQIADCIAATKPGGVGYIVADKLHKDLQRGKQINYRKTFPNISRKLLVQSKRATVREIDALLHPDCRSVPKL
jgi:hypothetical protein